MSRYIVGAFLLLGTLGSGWLHGRLVNRWGQASPLATAAARLQGGLPDHLGHWQLVKTHELEEGVADILQCAAYLHGVYTNDQTGDTIVVALVAGPSGPISVHTPEICYSAQNYEIAGDRELMKVRDLHGNTHQVWQVFANSRDSARPNLRVIYGWSRGANWEAVAGPRFAYAGLPVLYKLQLAGPAREHRSSQPSADACQDFLSEFLAQIQPRLISAPGGDSFIHPSAPKGVL
ncbi:MAG TPA: exosortase-associated EpsI family protein [Pirellulaceae bacterium]|nr:exosortase-associated EpsI family protein [Pirellulaceae bacterium]